MQRWILNKKVVETLKSEGEVYYDNSAYSFDASNPNNEVFKNNETLKKVLSDKWIRIQTCCKGQV